MSQYLNGRVKDLRYIFWAVIAIMAFSVISSKFPEPIYAAVEKGKEDVDSLGATDSTTLLTVGTSDEEYDKLYDKDGYPRRGYLSSSEVQGKHIKSKSIKAAFKKRLARVYMDFIDTMGQKALDIAVHFSKNKGVDIPPSVILAQAISESRYGTSRLAVQGNNYFGVQYHKRKRGIKGPIVAKDADHKKKVKQYNFAHYETPWWSLFHHAMLLKNLYGRRLLNADIPLRERWFAAICGCQDSRMLAKDSKHQRMAGGFYYAAACEYIASDGKTSKYVATLKYIVRTYKLEKLDQEWERLKRQ